MRVVTPPARCEDQWTTDAILRVCITIGLDPLSRECTRAVDLLVHQGYIQPGASVRDSYKITPQGGGVARRRLRPCTDRDATAPVERRSGRRVRMRNVVADVARMNRWYEDGAG
jgi:hypothetical protein